MEQSCFFYCPSFQTCARFIPGAFLFGVDLVRLLRKIPDFADRERSICTAKSVTYVVATICIDCAHHPRYNVCMLNYDDSLIRNVLERTKTIAMVGASPRPERASHRVGQFLTSKGYRVIPVNPGQAGKQLFGVTAVASLSDIQETVDMVDIFRRAEHVGPVVDEALGLSGLQTIWMQLGIVNEEAAAWARAAGVDVIMDRCPAIEYPRVIGG